MSPRWRTLLAAILVSLFLGAADCDDRSGKGTLVCKDGTVTSGQGAHEVCAEHGGVA